MMMIIITEIDESVFSFYMTFEYINIYVNNNKIFFINSYRLLFLLSDYEYIIYFVRVYNILQHSSTYL